MQQAEQSFAIITVFFWLNQHQLEIKTGLKSQQVRPNLDGGKICLILINT